MLASVSAVRSMSLARMKVPIQCISKRSSLTAAASEDMKGTKEGASVVEELHPRTVICACALIQPHAAI